MNTRSRPVKRRQPKAGKLGWRRYDTHAMAETAARTYIARCRAEYKPDGHRVLTQRENGTYAYYPVLVVHDAKARELHTRSEFRVVGA